MKKFKLYFRYIFIVSYIYIYIYHHVVPQSRISLTLSHHFSLSFIASGRSSGPHPVSSHSCWMYVRAGRPALTAATHLFGWRLWMRIKHTHRKIIVIYLNHMFNPHRPSHGDIWLRLERSSQCSKNHRQNLNKNENYLNLKAQYKLQLSTLEL